VEILRIIGFLTRVIALQQDTIAVIGCFDSVPEAGNFGTDGFLPLYNAVIIGQEQGMQSFASVKPQSRRPAPPRGTHASITRAFAAGTSAARPR
jgi:hypothetical protein